MPKSKWFFAFLLIVWFLLWAAAASADIAGDILALPYNGDVEYTPSFIFTGFHASTYTSGQFNVSPSTTAYQGGLEINGGGSSGPIAFVDEPFDYSISLDLTGYLNFGLWFPEYENQAEVPHGSVTCNATVLVGGTETTICSGTVDQAMLQSRVGIDHYGQNIIWFEGSGDLGTIDVPVIWYDLGYGCWEEYCSINNSWPVTFTITADEAPLPSTLLLLGTGLGGLAIYGRRKLLCRS
jgi:hypothetical protein